MNSLDRKLLIIWAIVLVVFAGIALVLPVPHTAGFFVAWIATILSFAMVLYSYVSAFKKKETLESKLLGAPVFLLAQRAFLLQIIVGIILMIASAKIPVWATVIIEVFVLAGTAVCLIAKEAVRDVVTESEAKVQENTQAWKAIRAAATALASNGDPELKKLAEGIRYADPTPCNLDAEISDTLEALKADPKNAALISQIKNLVAQRKTLAKEAKN